MIPLVIIGVYLAILLLLGVSSNRLFRGTSLDYLLASHSIGPFLLLMSLFGTTMTAFSLVGSTGESYKAGIAVYGLMGSSSALLHPLCFFIVGLKVWSIGKRHGYATQIEFFCDRLESPRFGWILFPVVVSLVIPYVLIGILGGGGTIHAVTDIPAWGGSLIICVVVLTYVFLGGMRGTAWANAFQTSVFLALGVITFVVLVKGIGGAETFMESLRAATAKADQEKLSREHFPHSLYFAFLLIPLSIGMFPHIFQHWLTARNASAFKLPVVAHPIFVMIVWAPCVLIGTWVSGDAEIAGLISDGDLTEKSILGYLVKKHSGDVLTGLLTAGILAAIMSSMDSQFLCLGTMFAKDVMGRGSGGEEDDRKTVLMTRGFVVAVVAVCYALALIAPRGVFNLAIWCFSGFSGLFPLIIAALYWRGLTKAGAWCAVSMNALLWMFMFWQSDFAGNARYRFHDLHPIVPLVFGTTIVLVTVSLVTSKPGDETLKKFFPEK